MLSDQNQCMHLTNSCSLMWTFPPAYVVVSCESVFSYTGAKYCMPSDQNQCMYLTNYRSLMHTETSISHGPSLPCILDDWWCKDGGDKVSWLNWVSSVHLCYLCRKWSEIKLTSLHVALPWIYFSFTGWLSMTACEGNKDKCLSLLFLPDIVVWQVLLGFHAFLVQS